VQGAGAATRGRDVAGLRACPVASRRRLHRPEDSTEESRGSPRAPDPQPRAHPRHLISTLRRRRPRRRSPGPYQPVRIAATGDRRHVEPRRRKAQATWRLPRDAVLATEAVGNDCQGARVWEAHARTVVVEGVRPDVRSVRPLARLPCDGGRQALERGGEKRALITGITGQDGSYLAEWLLSEGYEVVGMVRRSSTLNFERIAHIQDA